MLKALLYQSRSYRSFDESVKIPYEALVEFIDCARLTPSSMNLQVLKFRPVTDSAECDRILSCTGWAASLKDVKLPPQGHAPTAYIVICADKQLRENAESFQRDLGICAQTIMLAATEAGFGGCMIGSFSPEKVSAALTLPSHILPLLVLALGKPDEKVSLTEPKENGSVTYYRENGIHFVPKRKLKDLILK